MVPTWWFRWRKIFGFCWGHILIQRWRIVFVFHWGLILARRIWRKSSMEYTLTYMGALIIILARMMITWRKNWGRHGYQYTCLPHCHLWASWHIFIQILFKWCFIWEGFSKRGMCEKEANDSPWGLLLQEGTISSKMRKKCTNDRNWDEHK